MAKKFVFGTWYPIETAPKDGTRILAYGLLGFETENGIGTVVWDWGRFVIEPNEATEYESEKCELSHWTPLPPPPTAEAIHATKGEGK